MPSVPPDCQSTRGHHAKEAYESEGLITAVYIQQVILGVIPHVVPIDPLSW